MTGPSRIRDGMRVAAPYGLAAAAIGISYGVLARAAGMGSLAPVVMSATTFAGSAQVAVASILDDHGGLIAAVVAAIMLNLRYGAIGISVAPSLEGGPLRRLLQAQLVVDESWALSNRGGGRFDRKILIGAGLALYIGWVGGTAAGVIGGDLLGDPERIGLDAAFPALFLALLVPLVRSRLALGAALLGAGIALTLIPLARPGIPVVVACLGCLVGLLTPPREPDEEEGG